MVFPDFILCPTTQIFTLACLLFFVGIKIVYHLKRDNEWPDMVHRIMLIPFVTGIARRLIPVCLQTNCQRIYGLLQWLTRGSICYIGGSGRLFIWSLLNVRKRKGLGGGGRRERRPSFTRLKVDCLNRKERLLCYWREGATISVTLSNFEYEKTFPLFRSLTV